MKKIFLLIVVLMMVMCAAGAKAFAETKWDNLLEESARVFEEMTEMPEEGIPKSLVDQCYAIVIIPSTIKGGFIIGGTYGQGVILAKNTSDKGWSAPAVFNLAGGSFGWQIGGQAVDIVLLVMSERGLDGLLSSRFKLGGDAAVSAGPLGRSAEAATDLQLKGGLLSYSRSRGLFLGLKLEGAVLSYNEEANISLYGKTYTAKEILNENKVKPTKSASRLLNDLKGF